MVERYAFFLVLIHEVRECDVKPAWGENRSDYEENKWFERKVSFSFVFPVSYMYGIMPFCLVVRTRFVASIGFRDRQMDRGIFFSIV